MLALFVSRAEASPINLLTNGSFESGLAGWTSTGGGSFPVSAVTTNTNCCFGEFVPNDNIVGGSPDAAGNHAVYFVDDVAHQTLTQSLALAAGKYEIGFDAYAPLNGFNNARDASFTGTIAGVQLANYTVHTQGTPQLWIHFSGLANILSAGTFQVAFDFLPGGGPASDVVIDRVYIVESDRTDPGTPIGNAAVPEPTTILMVGAGLGLAARRLRRR